MASRTRNPGATTRFDDAGEATAPAVPTDKAEAPTTSTMGHQFWTNTKTQYDPKLQFRFKVVIPGMGLEDARPAGDKFTDDDDGTGGLVWYAKSVDKPGWSVEDANEDKYYHAGKVAKPKLTVDSILYKKVSMTLVDPLYPNATRKLVRMLRRSGFNDQKAMNAVARLGLSQSEAYIDSMAGPTSQKGPRVPRVEIHTLDHFGETQEKWTLLDAYPAEVDFGKLDYSSDDLVEITVRWGFRTFKCDFIGLGKEQDFPYFPQDQGTSLPEGATACKTRWEKLSATGKAAYQNNFENFSKKRCK